MVSVSMSAECKKKNNNNTQYIHKQQLSDCWLNLTEKKLANKTATCLWVQAHVQTSRPTHPPLSHLSYPEN